jgi:hypothetical protein
MPLKARGAKQNILVLWLGDVAKRHGRDRLAAGVAVLVIPRGSLDGEAARIILLSFVRNQNSMATRDWIPATPPGPTLGLRNFRCWLSTVRNKNSECVNCRNPALHPQKCHKLRSLLVSHCLGALRWLTMR